MRFKPRKYSVLCYLVISKPQAHHFIIQLLGILSAKMCFHVFPGFIHFNPEDEETSEPSVLTVIIIVTTIVIALCTFIVHVANGLCSQEHNHQVSQIY